MANFAYLVGSRSARQAFVVDPAWDVDALLDTAEADGTLAPDVNGDCTVDAIDLEQFARSFGAEFGDPIYSVLLDFNSDDIIDGRDFAIFAADYGRSTS